MQAQIYDFIDRTSRKPRYLDSFSTSFPPQAIRVFTEAAWATPRLTELSGNTGRAATEAMSVEGREAPMLG
jgi:hypothetical protein